MSVNEEIIQSETRLRQNKAFVLGVAGAMGIIAVPLAWAWSIWYWVAR